METLAFTHAAEAYEDPTSTPQLREFELPTSALVGALSTAVVVGAVFGAAPDAHALIYPGDSGASVVSLQQALVAQGYSTGGVDGVFGPATLSAVRRFQNSNGLVVDGVVGPATASLLGISSGGGGGGGGGGSTTVVAGSGLNVRSGPGTNFPVIDTLPFGARVTVIDTFGGWSEIAGGGFVSSGFLGSGGGGGGGSGGGGGGGDVIVSTNGGGLNARFGPGVDFGIATNYGDGAALFTTGRTSGGWVELTNGLWVDGSWLI